MKCHIAKDYGILVKIWYFLNKYIGDSQWRSQGRIFRGSKKDVVRGRRGQKGMTRMKGAKKDVEPKG